MVFCLEYVMASHELLTNVPLDAFSGRTEAAARALRSGKPVTYRADRVVDTIHPNQAREIVKRIPRLDSKR